jgi:putative oxidoreductase
MSSIPRDNWDDIGKLVLRFTVAFLLIFHGIGKVEHGIAWMKGPLSAYHLPFFIGYGVYVAEIIAPVLILVGFLTRPAALVVVFDLIMAILLVAWHRLFALTKGGSYALEAEAFFLLLGVVLFFQGPGRYSVTRDHGPWWL